MTLKEWSEKHRVCSRPYDKAGFAKMMTLSDDLPLPARKELYRLSDYFVRDHLGGCYWLMEKANAHPA